MHWQETFRVFTTPNSSDEKEGGGVVDRVLPIDEFRYSIYSRIFYYLNINIMWETQRFVMSSLNISGRRIVTAEEVDEMIAVSAWD